MAGGNPPNAKGSSEKPSSSSHYRKSGPPKPSPSKTPQQHPYTSKHETIPKPNPDPHPLPRPVPTPFHENLRPPAPPPASGFHTLERRSIVLADGSVRSYFALPPDYQHFAPSRPRPLMELGLGFDRQFSPGRPIRGLEDLYRHPSKDYWNSHGLEPSQKRKYADEGNDDFTRQRQQLLQYGNVMAGPSSSRDESRAAKYMKAQGDYGHGGSLSKHMEVDQAKLKMAFLKFLRLMNENADQKMKYLEDGKQGSFQCLACGRSSREFSDMHSLIMHAYDSYISSSDQALDHLGLHKASCVLMGWNYLMPPDNSKAYQRLSAEEASANKDDLIMWPPHVIIRNTVTGKSRSGRMDGLSSKAVDNKLRDLGFGSGKSKSLFGREGHMGITVVKFAGDESGLKDAVRLAEFFEKEKHGQRAWASVQSLLTSRKDEENNPSLVKLDNKTGEKERVLYGYLGTVFDLDKLDSETRKDVMIASRREFNLNPHR